MIIFRQVEIMRLDIVKLTTRIKQLEDSLEEMKEQVNNFLLRKSYANSLPGRSFVYDLVIYYSSAQ